MRECYKIGILGVGSIGTRHVRNIAEILTEQGKRFTIDLIRSGYGRNLETEIDQYLHKVYTLSDILPEDYDILFVTNPTYLHYDTIKKNVSRTKHMFIEKPVFDRTDILLDELKLRKDSIYYVACPLRYSDVIQYLKNQCDLSNVYSVRTICSSYLPDWRPGQDYRDSYSAHKDQGGGVSIDLIHEWDYLCYLFGLPEQVWNIRGKFSNLEIDSDDLSVYIAKYRTMAAEVHLDYFGRKSIREIQIFTNQDTIIGDLIGGEVRYLKSGKIISFQEQKNDLYRKEIEYFLKIVEGEAINHNDINNALSILRIAKEGLVE